LSLTYQIAYGAADVVADLATAADLADGAASCERAAAMRGTGELQLSMAIIASSRPEQKPALARDPSTVKR